jgi:hypothetical protein
MILLSRVPIRRPDFLVNSEELVGIRSWIMLVHAALLPDTALKKAAPFYRCPLVPILYRRRLATLGAIGFIQPKESGYPLSSLTS